MSASDEIDALLLKHGPKQPLAFEPLRPHADFVRSLRQRRASFDTIQRILQTRGVEVSASSVQRFCREVLQEAAVWKKRRAGSKRVRETIAVQNQPATSRPASETQSPPPDTVVVETTPILHPKNADNQFGAAASVTPQAQEDGPRIANVRKANKS